MKNYKFKNLRLGQTESFKIKLKKEIIKKGISIIKHGDYTYPITRQLIKDGKKNKVLSRKIKKPIKVVLFHGSKDDVVPISFSKKTLKIFTKAKKKLIIVKNGDHSLSTKKNLNKIKKELDKMIINNL